MGIDYKAAYGFGIEFTDCEAEKCIESGIFSQDDWDDDAGWCIDETGAEFEEIGSHYSGNINRYAVFKPKSIADGIEKQEKFINDMSTCGIVISDDDVKFISGVLVY